MCGSASQASGETRRTPDCSWSGDKERIAAGRVWSSGSPRIPAGGTCDRAGCVPSTFDGAIETGVCAILEALAPSCPADHRRSYAERVTSSPAENGDPQRTVAELIADLTWDDLVADGIITLGEIEADLRAKGLDPCKYDYLYD